VYNDANKFYFLIKIIRDKIEN
ncbi:hypothetical protein A5815_002534, partial [Enterococcus faecium]